MLKEDYLKTVSTLTNLPVSFLSQLYKIHLLVVSNELSNQLLSNDTKKVSLSTYGEVKLQIENNSLIYKFIPSDEFNSVVRKTVLEKRDLLESKLEEKLVKKIYANYDDFMDGTLYDVEKKNKVETAYNNIAKFVKQSSKISKKELLDYIASQLVPAGLEVKHAKKEE